MTHSGGKPHTNIEDKGQRYEITYLCKTEKKRKVFGWSGSKNKAKKAEDDINLHPSMDLPQIVDRWRIRWAFREGGIVMVPDDEEGGGSEAVQ